MRHLKQLFLFAGILVLVGQGCISVGGGEQGTSGPAGMFITTDKGENWQQISLLPTAEGVSKLDEVSVYRLVEDPQDTKAYYWLSRNNGYFFTYDEGRTWQRPAAPFNTGFVYDLAVHPEDKCTIAATNGTLVFMTEDCGRSWEEVYREAQDDQIRSIEYEMTAPHDMYMAKSRGDILKSVDGGQTWQVKKRLGRNIRIAHMLAHPEVDGLIYVATRESGLYRSTDRGETWEEIEDALDGYSGGLTFRRLAFHPTEPGVVYWISKYGILVSGDQGDSWEPMDLIHPPGSANIYGFDINPSNPREFYYTATIDNRSTFYKSEDAGRTWTTKRLPTGQIPTALMVHPTKGDLVYIGFTIPPEQ